MKALFKNVEVLDSGARGATNTFVERGIGDVLIARENEALLATNELGKDKFEIVTPSESIPAEPTVSVVDKVVDKKGTKAVAEVYLKYLYSPEGQEIAAKNFYRPRDEAVAKKYENAFPKLKLFTIDDVFGGWTKAQKSTSLTAAPSTRSASAKRFTKNDTVTRCEKSTGFLFGHHFALLFCLY